MDKEKLIDEVWTEIEKRIEYNTPLPNPLIISIVGILFFIIGASIHFKEGLKPQPGIQTYQGITYQIIKMEFKK